ncbi:chemotaxis protein CheA [Paenibacillus sp. FSL R7-0331]|uniref:chemotaxis protein CheA n=1 Tax=Paenibacillus sp. FSL R7-0331 TaxID=1536773 RepID=UPI0004F69A7D|nr:chemotaxis protein CheA [Paenibacillus sp. FSL R7-0331]AIQ53443.1 hypothetical protein R70331_19195 [Paenibacillus sp. FSL R7-0331]
MMDLSAYRDIFIEELNDQLERMDQSLLNLENAPSAEQIQILFRAAHTIKGSAATMNFREMSDLTHEVEYALEWVREKKPEISPLLIDTLFRSLDAMKLLRNQYIDGSTFADCRGVVAEIQALIRKPPAMKLLPLPVLSASEIRKAEEASASGQKLLAIQIIIRQDCQMKAARYHILHKQIEEQCGEIITTGLSPVSAEGDSDDRYRRFAVITATVKELVEVKAWLEGDLDVELLEIQPFLTTVAVKTEDSKGMVEVAVPSRLTEQVDDRGKVNQPTVRVNVERLDYLMNLVGELLIDQTSLSDLNALGRRGDPSKVLESISEVSDHMGGVIRELQDGVMKTRMLPIDQLFSRFPRLIRDLSQKLGKEMELVVQGGETELDRMIIEELSDPLIHLIRNSADHGLESPEERAALGKPAKGRITLTSFHEENHVVIQFEDDGKGIDGNKIKASALDKGLITAEQAAHMNEQEAVHLIFEPGFSTASQVSEVSGRGVGMDIVRSQIGRLNGMIDIDTTVSKGTCFTIRLPLTLAIIKGLLVKVSGRVLIIPMYNVVEIVRISPDDIQTIHGGHAIMNHGRIVPFSWLRDKLQYPRMERKSKTISLVIVRSVDKSAAFAVDEIIGNQEVVIKTLGTYLGAMNHLSGATILGNGQVAVILDASYLVNH